MTDNNLRGDDTLRLDPLYLTRQIDEICDRFEQRLDSPTCDLRLSELLQQIADEGRDRLLKELVLLAIDRLKRQGTNTPVPTLIAANSEIAIEIESVLAAISDEAATAFYTPQASEQPLDFAKLTPRRKPSRGLKIRCPHCSNHVELIGDTSFDSVDCTVCGSTFSLVDRSTETRMAKTLQQIDRFQLVSRIGVGGFGTVWKARDTQLDRVVAVKIPRHTQLSPEEMEQFFREARSAAQLRHPNIVPVHEVGREGDAVFIVSDFIRGVSLSDFLTGKLPTFAESAALCVVVAEALEHAHKRGVVHRDLKPSNIMIDDAGLPHLMDFGLAKRDVDEVTMTVDGQIVGTAAYMSPEQASGKSAFADRRSDIYSLGVTLFEMLTGELPFRGNAQMQVHQRLNDEAPSVRTLNRNIAIDLATITAKCLEREPGRRYQTAQEVADELRRYLNKEPIKARPLSIIERSIRWTERNPSRAATIGLVLLLAIGGPIAAATIAVQRAQLFKQLGETNLLVERLKTQSEANARRAEADKKRIAVYEAEQTPWSLWPIDGPSPRSSHLRRILDKRGQLLTRVANDPTSQAITRLQASIALALLYEAEKRPDEASRILELAIAQLQSLAMESEDPQAAKLALVNCYSWLSKLASGRDNSKATQWLAKSRDLIHELVLEKPGDARLQTDLLDLQLQAASSQPSNDPASQLASIKQASHAIDSLWPTTIPQLFDLVLHLTQRPDPLDSLTGKFQASSTDSTD